MATAHERGLALRAARGEQEAFSEIVRAHQRAVFNVAYRLLGNARDAEDAAQEALLRAYQFFDKFDADRPLGPWLKRITVNVCLNRLERIPPAASLDEGLPPPPDPHPGPEAETVKRLHDERIRKEILSLPPRYRVIIELRHFQELSYEEIARELDRPLSDVKSDLFRARKLLAERLKDIVDQ
ncbi:MAG: sigma-70 family RNA polymerase sigma factor [Chloroflexota bacterium]